ncbi:MAG: hypothetical protein L0322_07765 [Chloroflexi bacterium]|nr:hypothetical protein [Chloroflexota bacterium]MCI0646622.1 hypothetical protein [Chloroflexota bacterium]
MEEDVDKRRLVRNFVVELVVYAVLVVAYFLLVLRLLGDWLAGLYRSNLILYAPLALALIVLQGVLLEMLTAFLIERLGLERLE